MANYQTGFGYKFTHNAIQRGKFMNAATLSTQA